MSNADIGQAIMFGVLVGLVGFGILMTLVLLGLFNKDEQGTLIQQPMGTDDYTDFPRKGAQYYDQLNKDNIQARKDAGFDVLPHLDSE